MVLRERIRLALGEVAAHVQPTTPIHLAACDSKGWIYLETIDLENTNSPARKQPPSESDLVRLFQP